ncbi:MAG: hypothetical protein JWN84_4511 [Nocardioides sp.]|nr:hypothetical protein [Nocardioides sp.]
MTSTPASCVELVWIPLGSGPGSALVRASGRAFEALAAARQHRRRQRLFHTALSVRVDGVRWTIEMTPDWSPSRADREVVVRGPVGLPVLGRSRCFRYAVHRWREGVIGDLASAVDSPQRLSSDRHTAQLLLDLVAAVPAYTWGRDEQHAGEMWNSNSVNAWLIVRSGLQVDGLHPPDHGRAPGWAAGLVVARRAGAGAPTRPSTAHEARMSAGRGLRHRPAHDDGPT